MTSSGANVNSTSILGPATLNNSYSPLEGNTLLNIHKDIIIYIFENNYVLYLLHIHCYDDTY